MRWPPNAAWTSAVKKEGYRHFEVKGYGGKKDERWVIYAKDVEATKITSEWFLWMHHTVNELPLESSKKYSWQKNHSQNLSGSSKAYKPNKISKKIKFKNYETWKN